MQEVLFHIYLLLKEYELAIKNSDLDIQMKSQVSGIKICGVGYRNSTLGFL
jgi:hypothetical protein